jgi:hypothetical protein
MLEPVGTEDDEKSVLQVAAPLNVNATLMPPAGAAWLSLRTTDALEPSVTLSDVPEKKASCVAAAGLGRGAGAAVTVGAAKGCPQRGVGGCRLTGGMGPAA